MRIYKTLKDLAPGTQYAISFASTNGENDSEWSQAQIFTTTSDVIPPAPVVNLAWYNSGDAFTSQWDKVVTNQDGTVLKDFRYYRVTVTDGTTARDYFVLGEKFEFTKAENLDLFGSIKTSITVTVRAVDLTYNESAPRSVTASPANPPTPSKPIIRKTVGLLNVEWDGLTSTGVNMPANLAYIEVHASTTSNFTPTDATNVTAVTLEGRRAVIDNLTYGSAYYIRFVAVNTIRKKSAASVQETGTPTRISGLDIENGQIGTAQINFTAFDIGGANAYYQTSQPTTGMKNGDLWYDTDDGYTVYRYNGSTWVAAPEVGQISGTKILAGTVTANAIGTNQIIASSANIATAAIDSANIASLKADKIVAGTVSAELVLSGRIATALTGARTEINSQGIFKFDSSGNTLVAIDGTQALLTGTYKSAATGRRIEMTTGSASTRITFYDDGTKSAYITGFTARGVDNENDILTVGLEVTGTETGSKRINIARTSVQFVHNKSVFYALPNATMAETVVGATWPVGGTNNTYYWFVSPRNMYFYNHEKSKFIFNADTSGNTTMYPGNTNGRFFIGADGTYYIDPGSSRGYLEVSGGGGNGSPMLKFWPDGQGGPGIKGQSDGRGQWLEVRAFNDASFYGIRAAIFEVNSDRRDKTNIKKVTKSERSTMLEEISATDLHHYRRLNKWDEKANKLVPNDYEEIGLIAQEAPSQIVNGNEETRFGIDSYQMSAMMWGAIQELNEKINRLENKE